MSFKEFFALSYDFCDRGIISVLLMILIGLPGTIYSRFAPSFAHAVIFTIINGLLVLLGYCLVKHLYARRKNGESSQA